MVELSRKFDVLVIGGGNAALCAAISARRAGASVLVLEGAPKFYRGGNTRHTRNMRCAHDAATDILTGPYTEEEFWNDLLVLTGRPTRAAKHMIKGRRTSSAGCGTGRALAAIAWGHAEPRPHQFVPRGGRAMLNALY
jgi:tricarballylate dehydrogenase